MKSQRSVEPLGCNRCDGAAANDGGGDGDGAAANDGGDGDDRNQLYYALRTFFEKCYCKIT